MSTVTQYPCSNCGAELEYKPGSTVLVCPYCGHTTPIAPPSTDTLSELPYSDYTNQAHLDYAEESRLVLRCQSCAAEFTVEPTEASKKCPFCGVGVLVESPNSKRIRPGGILPYVLTEPRGRMAVKEWLKHLFWAPNNLAKSALQNGKLAAFYVPFWTYDSDTVSDYTGMRGEHYWESESYTVTDANGRTRTETRQVMKTRWYPASGRVDVSFDDLLVLASEAVPPEYAQGLSTWNLTALQSYNEQFLAGYSVLRYSRDLALGFEAAKQMMVPEIHSAIRSDIGGDEQAIHSVDTSYFHTTFKHLLLPIFVGAYQYRNKRYIYVVNGQSGEVKGSAPISFWKVFFAVLLGLIVVSVIVYFYVQSQKNQ